MKRSSSGEVCSASYRHLSQELKDRCGGEPQKHHHVFQHLTRDLKENHFDIHRLLPMNLFKGHDNLTIKYFNSSLHPSSIRLALSYQDHHNNNNNNNYDSLNNDGNDNSNNKGDDGDGGEETHSKRIKIDFEDTINFCERILNCDESAHHVLLDTMAMYRKGDVAVSQVYPRVAPILQKHPDLMGEFKGYLSEFSEQQQHNHVALERHDCDRGEETPPNEKLKRGFEEAISFFKRIKRLKHDDMRAYRLFMDTMATYKKGKVAAYDVYKQVELIFEKHSDLMEEFKVYLSAISGGRRRINPSYLFLPGRNSDEAKNGDADQEVLNKTCVSVAAGCGDYYSCGEKDRNKYEDFCEDQRFEMDLLSETLISTTKQVKEFMDKLNDGANVGPIMNAEEYLKPRDIRCIENLYGDDGMVVINILKEKPKVALPVVLVRLIQKQKELREYKSDFNNVFP